MPKLKQNKQGDRHTEFMIYLRSDVIFQLPDTYLVTYLRFVYRVSFSSGIRDPSYRPINTGRPIVRHQNFNNQ